MPDAIEDAIYYDGVVDECCTCTAVRDGEEGPLVVLKYLQSGSTVTVPLEPFKQTTSIEVRRLPGEPDVDQPVS